MNHEITHFAKTNFRSQEAVFGIKTDDRRRHMYVIGKTGMGKTNMLENLAVQDIRNGHGVAFIDPHGDSAEKLISMIPPDRINDVIYFNPCDRDFPISFNVMERVAPEHRPLVASGIVGVFQKLWADSWGPRLEYILRNAVLALLEYPGSTLLGVMRILVDPKYRKRVTDKITDPVVRAFWMDEFPKWNERVLQEVISPIQNKVGQFLTSPLVRNVVGQTTSAFNVREAMDEQKIIILNLSKGRIGEDNSALLGAMMITKIQLAAMSRVNIEEDVRKDFYLYVDEFQNFATESFANILSEARKYRLNLILANQYIAQIDEIVRDAIFGNAGTIVSFRVGAADAEHLEKEFEPVFTMNDIINLEKYCIYLKLMIDGIAGDAFSAQTLPPIERMYEDSTDKVVKVSRERYSQGREEVEEKISRSNGMAQANNAPQENVRVIRKSEYEKKSPTPIKQKSQSQSHTQSQSQQRPQSQSQSKVKPQSQSQQPQQSQSQKIVSAVPAKPVAASQKRHDTPVAKEKSQSQIEEKSLQEEKVVYEATCATCGDEITVPFKPDGKRPTFCKECLKDYQRVGAQTRHSKEGVQDEKASSVASAHKKPHKYKEYSRKQEKKEADVQKTVTEKAYAPQEQPMKLSQMQKIAPKKFGKSSPKTKPDLKGIREMIDEAQGKDFTGLGRIDPM